MPSSTGVATAARRHATSTQERRGKTATWSPSTSRVRDELLNVELFSCLAEARVVIADWQEDYNARRTRSALGRRTPAAFAIAWAADHAAALA